VMQADPHRTSLDPQRRPAAVIKAQATSLRELVGRPLPRVALESAGGSVGLGELADAHDLVVYVDPGSEQSPAGEDVRRVDGILHRAFRVNAKTLHALGFHVLGISSQQTKAQRRVVNNRLEYQMLSDPHLLLARELGVPTFATSRGCWYQRTFIVVQGGRIAWVQFPVREPSRAPAQAIAWIHTHDTNHTSAWPDAS
jgi:hypothetical protein